MSGNDTRLSCDCGEFQATLTDVNPRRGVHLRCHCADCRAFVRVLVPDAQLKNGLHLFQTDPDTIEVTKGGDYLECLTLSRTGMLRWYAACCKTPMFNTPRRAKVPMVSVLTECSDDPRLFGPVICDAFLKTSTGRVKTTALSTLIFRFATRVLSSRLSGRWKTTPFFSFPENVPIDKPNLMSKNEMRAAYKP